MLLAVLLTLCVGSCCQIFEWTSSFNRMRIHKCQQSIELLTVMPNAHLLMHSGCILYDIINLSPMCGFTCPLQDEVGKKIFEWSYYLHWRQFCREKLSECYSVLVYTEGLQKDSKVYNQAVCTWIKVYCSNL